MVVNIFFRDRFLLTAVFENMSALVGKMSSVAANSLASEFTDGNFSVFFDDLLPANQTLGQVVMLEADLLEANSSGGSILDCGTMPDIVWVKVCTVQVSI